MKNTEKTMDRIVALCKNRGFIFAGSEIYGGLANTWDYGPLGVERTVLSVLCDAYDEQVVGQDKKGNDDIRTVLHLHPALAPFKCAILPLSKKEILTGPAMELYNELSRDFMCDYDETGSIGKRYRREDEIGTPFCITFDFNTVGTETDEADHCVTVRERDSMEQVRIPISEVKAYISERIKF